MKTAGNDRIGRLNRRSKRRELYAAALYFLIARVRAPIGISQLDETDPDDFGAFDGYEKGSSKRLNIADDRRLLAFTKRLQQQFEAMRLHQPEKVETLVARTDKACEGMNDLRITYQRCGVVIDQWDSYLSR